MPGPWLVPRRAPPAARAIDTGTTQHKVHYDEVVVVNYYCDIRIYADPAGRLIKWERDGNARVAGITSVRFVNTLKP